MSTELLDSISDTSVLDRLDITIQNKMKEVDENWLKNSFLVDISNLEAIDQQQAFWSNAYLKYTDTSLGGNFGINTKYGFTPTADVPISGRLAGREELDVMSETLNFGMGRRYSEMFDDNEDILYLQMGNPVFNSLIDYITGAMDYGTAVVANTGRSLMAYYAGFTLGTITAIVATFIAFPAMGAILFLGVMAIGKLLSVGSDFKYYRLEPAMHKYWRAVNTMTSSMGVELGLLHPVFQTETQEATKLGMPVKLEAEYIEMITELMPDILSEDGYFDVMAVANKAQVLANKQKIAETRYYTSLEGQSAVPTTYADKIIAAESRTFTSYLNQLVTFYQYTDMIIPDSTVSEANNNGDINKEEAPKTSGSITDAFKTISSQGESVTTNPDGTRNITEATAKRNDSKLQQMAQYVDASARHGSSYAQFRIEYIGSVTETFSNSITDVPLKDTLNNVSGKVKNVMFSISGGNLVSDSLDTAVKYMGDFAAGALEGVTFGFSNVIGSILSGGHFDVPKMWDDSSFEYQKHSFKIRLGGPYGHPIAQLQDMYIPLFMLIAATAAQSVGPAAYTSPMLSSAFIKGKLNSSLGMIDSLSIERGSGSMGWDKYGRPLAIDVTFSYVDFSSFITVPIEAGIFGPIRASLDDENGMNKYIRMLAARSLYNSTYFAPRTKLKLARALNQVNMLNDPSSIGMAIGEFIGNSPIGALIPGIAQPETQIG